MTVFLPWFGHFGDLVRDVLPWLWARYRQGDVIGGNPAHAALYPAPPDARLWDPVASFYPDGFDYRRRSDDLEAELRMVASRLWPNATLLTWQADGEDYPKPALALPEPYPIDVVVAPRAKPYADAKNAWAWADLVTVLRAQGWSVGVAGSRQESLAITADVAAWDLEVPGDAITGTLRLLRGARAVVTLDSGIGHLASLIDAPQMVLYERRGDERREIPIRDGVPTRMRFGDMHRWNQNLCLPIYGGVDHAITAIEEVLTRTRIIPGEPDVWKGRHVSEVPGWESGETVVTRNSYRSLIMRPTGNDLIDTCPIEEPASPGPISADDFVRADRMALCTACDRWSGARCSAAGCPCALLGRSDLASSRCPLGRW